MEDGAILGPVDPDAPEHVRPALLHVRGPRHRQQQRQGLVGDPVLAVVEVQASALGGQALRPSRVVGEQVTQVAVLDAGMVGKDRLPLGQPVKGWAIVMSSVLIGPS